MSKLRDALTAARQSYESEKYGSDLGALAYDAAVPVPRRGARWVGAALATGGLAAAALLLTVSTPIDEPQPQAPLAVAPTMPAEPNLDARSTRLPRYRGAAKRVAQILANRDPLAPQRALQRRAPGSWASPLAFARPQPSGAKSPTAKTSVASAETAAAPPATNATARLQTPSKRRLSLSLPSLTFRSLSHANSIGT